MPILDGVYRKLLHQADYICVKRFIFLRSSFCDYATNWLKRKLCSEYCDFVMKYNKATSGIFIPTFYIR